MIADGRLMIVDCRLTVEKPIWPISALSISNRQSTIVNQGIVNLSIRMAAALYSAVPDFGSTASIVKKLVGTSSGWL
jgi:hypothetical protein